MQLNSYKIIFISIGLVCIILFSLPALNLFIPSESQTFSELYILGPNQTFGDLPLNIVAEETYLTYIGVTNNLGRASYYNCIIRIGNSPDDFPETKRGIQSELPYSYIFHFFVADGETWQTPLTLNFENTQFEDEICKIDKAVINGITVPVNQTLSWDSESNAFYFNLIVELWIFNPDLGITQFNNRFVSLPLNMLKGT